MEVIQYMSHFKLKRRCCSFSLGGTITKCTERCRHKHSSCLTAELNGVPLYSLVCVACKPPAMVLHEAASLSGIYVWTGHNCRLCCQEKGWLRVPVFSICPFFFIIEDNKDGK